MITGPVPLIDTKPGQSSRLWSALDLALRRFSMTMDNMLPASVISYDRTKNTAQVQPLIKVVMVDGTTISRHALADVPVVSIGGGGFNLNFPLKPGDFGWIIATDRDYSTFMSSLTESMPGSSRIHKFDSSVFMPDVLRQYTIASEDETAMVIQSTDSGTRISIDVGGNIRITAPTGVKIDTPIATFTHDVEIQGNLNVDGTADIVGTLTNNGIDVTTHGHLGNGAGNRTGNMEP